MERDEIYDLLTIANSESRSAYWRCQQITDYLLDQLVTIQQVELVAAHDAEQAELEVQRGRA